MANIGNEQFISKEELTELKREQHKSNREIGLIYNINRHHIDKLINKYNIKYKEKDEDFLINIYNENITFQRMADICGCTSSAIKLNLIKFKIIDDDRLEITCPICNKKTKNKGSYNGTYYCKKHTNHLCRHGKILERTIYDANDFIKHEEYLEIVLYNKKGIKIDSCIVDNDKYEAVKNLKWYKRDQGYCVTKGIDSNIGIPIHQVIMPKIDTSKYFYDHINKNKLDNRVFNLRKVTMHENGINASKRVDNRSGVIGVNEYNRDSIPKWNAFIMYKNKGIHLHRSISFDECVKSRILAECKYFDIYSPNYDKTTHTIRLTYTSKDDNKQTFIECDMNENIIEFKKL